MPRCDDNPVSLSRKKGGTRTMSSEHMETSWSEVAAALAVMGIITFLWLL